MTFRTSIVLGALLLSMPEGCTALLDRAKRSAAPEAKDAGASTTTVTARTEPVGSSAPALTAPPVWVPPEQPEYVPPPAAETPSDTSISAEMSKALEAFEAGDHKKVKALLEKKVRDGKGTADEARLLSSACQSLKDKACVDAATSAKPAD